MQWAFNSTSLLSLSRFFLFLFAFIYPKKKVLFFPFCCATTSWLKKAHQWPHKKNVRISPWYIAFNVFSSVYIMFLLPTNAQRDRKPSNINSTFDGLGFYEIRNKCRRCTFHVTQSLLFLSLSQLLAIKGRPNKRNQANRKQQHFVKKKTLK